MIAIDKRPTTLAEVVGHSLLMKELRKTSLSGYPQVMIFSGPTGIGKTTLAMIVAKTLTCLAPVRLEDRVEPCNACSQCKAVNEGSYGLDVRMLDAAQLAKNDLRLLGEEVAFVPIQAKRKVILIEEVQELFAKSQNTLLKLLERSFENVHFIFTMMDTSKASPAFLNRAQHYRLKPLKSSELAEALYGLCKTLPVFDELPDEFISEGLFAISDNCEGSVRTALQYLERAIAGGYYTKDVIAAEFGFHSVDSIQKILTSLLKRDPAGLDRETFTRDFFYQSNRVLVDAALWAIQQDTASPRAGGYKTVTSFGSFWDLFRTYQKIEHTIRDYFRSDAVMAALIEYYRMAVPAGLPASMTGDLPVRRIKE